MTADIKLKAKYIAKFSCISELQNGRMQLYFPSDKVHLASGDFTATYTTDTDTTQVPLALTIDDTAPYKYYVYFSFPLFTMAGSYTVTVTNGHETHDKTFTAGELSDVTGLSATASDSRVELTWTGVTGYSDYRVTCTGGASAIEPQTVSDSCFAGFSGLTNGTEYTFAVYTKANSSSDAAESSAVTATATPSITRKTSDWLVLMYMDGDNNLNDMLYELGPDYSADATYITSAGCILSARTKDLSYTAPWLASLFIDNQAKTYSGFYYDASAKTFGTTANAHTRDATYSEAVREILFTRLSAVSYLGTYTFLYDFGFAANQIIGMSAPTLSSGGTNPNAWPELYTAAADVCTALDSAIVHSWRDANNTACSLYNKATPSSALFSGTYCGLTICGGTVEIVTSAGTSVLGTAKNPAFYKNDLAFGKDSKWGTLLESWFE